MLAMDLNQALAEFAQLRKRDGGAIDKATGTAICVDHPAQQALIAVVQLVLLEPLSCRRGVRQ
ncbi:hypothetical protein D3C80_1515010 [compost metagenome]